LGEAHREHRGLPAVETLLQHQVCSME
jgi:hypothetical protein